MAAVFTQLFRVAPDKVDSLMVAEPNTETSIWLRGLGDLELEILWELLPGAESAGTLMTELISEPEAETLLFSVPENFLQCIRNLPDTDISTIIERWNQTEELADWSFEELAESFGSLRKLVNDAANADEIIVQRADF